MSKDLMIHYKNDKKWCTGNYDTAIKECGLEHILGLMGPNDEAFLIDYEDGIDLGDTLMLTHYKIVEPRFEEPPLTVERMNFLKAKYVELFVL
jgi:hypothetical protein